MENGITEMKSIMDALKKETVSPKINTYTHS